MNWNPECGQIQEVAAHGPGNIVFTTLEYENATEVFTGFGRVGTRAENIAKEVVRDTRNYLKSTVPAGPHLADQIMLPLGISTWQSRSDSSPSNRSFRTGPLTRHSTTHPEILRKFRGIEIQIERDEQSGDNTLRLTSSLL